MQVRNQGQKIIIMVYLWYQAVVRTIILNATKVPCCVQKMCILKYARKKTSIT